MDLSEEGLAGFFSTTLPLLDERQRRLMAAAMVEVLGRGGQARVAAAAGMCRNTLIKIGPSRRPVDGPCQSGL